MNEKNDNAPVQAPRSGAPRWMKVLLVVSLSLNLLVAGALVGAALGGGKPWRDGPKGPGGVGALTRALSEEDRRVLKRRMVREFASEREGRKVFRQEMAGVIDALRADTYDPEAVMARMMRVRGVFRDRMEVAQDMLVRYWGEMSPAARAAYADRLEQELRRGKTR